MKYYYEAVVEYHTFKKQETSIRDFSVAESQLVEGFDLPDMLHGCISYLNVISQVKSLQG